MIQIKLVKESCHVDFEYSINMALLQLQEDRHIIKDVKIYDGICLITYEEVSKKWLALD